jgi:hypothetical protein
LAEHGGHRANRAQLLTHGLEIRRREHAGVEGGGVHVLLEDVPTAEHDIVERREAHELVHRGNPILGALSEAYSSELCQRADRLGESFSDPHDSGDECGRDCAHAGKQDAELPFCRLDLWSHGRPSFVSTAR